MANHPTWRPLGLAASIPELPTLLVSVELESAAYTVRVTDMANMWIETLDRKAICMRGWSENTSIDPSDTPENMTRFLESIRSALDSSHSRTSNSTLAISPAAMSNAGEGGLTLTLTSDLPGFQPLKWPMHLRKGPPSDLTINLVLPLLGAQYSRIVEVNNLCNLLQEKDAVINKLLDKLESAGTGLEHIFNPLSGRKKVPRAFAERRVKGLAPFNQSKWTTEMPLKCEHPKDTYSLASYVFGEHGPQGSRMVRSISSESLDNWWCKLNGTTPISKLELLETVNGGDIELPIHTPEASNDDGGDSKADDDDDFETLPTLPHLARRKQDEVGSTYQAADDASTENETDFETADGLKQKSHSENASPKAAVSSTNGRLSRIGSKKPTALQTDNPRAPRNTTKDLKSAAADESNTASDESDDATASAPDSSPPPLPPSRRAPSKGKLGLIGRRGPATEVSHSEPVLEAPREIAESSSRPHKIGMIGKGVRKGPSVGKNNENDDDDDDEEAVRGREAIKNEETVKEAPRETSSERADRRREELKRDLEKKAAAAPAKKKRRF